MTFTLIDNNRDREKEFDTRAEAEEKKNDMISLGASPEDLEIVADSSNGAEDTAGADTNQTTQVESDGSELSEQAKEDITVSREQIENGEAVPIEETKQAIDQLGEELEPDPLSILPSHMIDEIQGKPAVNKRGYAMIAERYNIEVSARVKQFPWDNEEGRAVAHAVAVTEEGKEYSGWGTASAADGDMDDQLIELAETRSLKRAVSWASGVGIVSYQELMSDLQLNSTMNT